MAVTCYERRGAGVVSASLPSQGQAHCEAGHMVACLNALPGEAVRPWEQAVG